MRKMYCLAKKNFEAYSEVSPDAVRVNVLQGMCAEFIQENEYHWDFRLGNGQEFILETDDIEERLDVPEFIPGAYEICNALNYYQGNAKLQPVEAKAISKSCCNWLKSQF